MKYENNYFYNYKGFTSMAIYEEKPHNISQLEVEQAKETEVVLNEMEGQRVFGREHYEFWIISITLEMRNLSLRLLHCFRNNQN